MQNLKSYFMNKEINKTRLKETKRSSGTKGPLERLGLVSYVQTGFAYCGTEN